MKQAKTLLATTVIGVYQEEFHRTSAGME